MPEFHVDYLEVEPDEFIDACSKRELEELIDCLVEDGLVTRKKVPITDARGYDEQAFEEALIKLSGIWNMLSQAESEFIVNIAKRF